MIGGEDGVIIGDGFVVVANHDAVVFVLAGGVAVVPMLDCGEAGELVHGQVIVADIILQQGVCGGHMSQEIVLDVHSPPVTM